MPGCSFDSITRVERLSSGENHVVYRVSYLDHGGIDVDVVVRAGSGDRAERDRAHREATVMQQVGGIVGPEIFDFRPDHPGFAGPLMCMQYIGGEQRELDRVGPHDMQRLGRAVQRLHALPVPELLAAWTLSDLSLSSYAEERWSAHLASRLPSIRDPLPDALQRRLRVAVRVASESMQQINAFASGSSDEGLVLLHADLSGANVIWTPLPVLIDWEYARIGDPADEIAYLFTQNDLSEPQRAAFWQGYSGTTSTEATLERIVARSRLWEPMTLLGSIFWWLDAWSRSEASRPETSDPSLPRAPEYYLDQAVQRLDRFDRMFIRD